METISLSLVSITSTAKEYTSIMLIFLLAYLALVSALRFKRLDALQRKYQQYSTPESKSKMTLHDAWAIQKHILQLEFPTSALKALQFALFRTYGIPTISSLLHKTSQFSNPSTSFKRYADTGALIGQFVSFNPTSERALSSLARTKYLHMGYRSSGKILEEDMLYTLSLFALEPIRFVEMYEWRNMSELEMCAIGTYWMWIGEALGISFGGLLGTEKGFRDGLHWLSVMGSWSRGYEERCMARTESNCAVAGKTMDVLVYALPGWLKGVGMRFACCGMDERLREAAGYDKPPQVYSYIFNTLLITRKLILRFLCLPRPYFLRQDVFTDKPNKHGRFNIRVWTGAPYYVQPTLWNRYGPGAWLSRLVGMPVPGDEGEKYHPNGYETLNLGPRAFEGRGSETVERTVAELRADWRECPFQ